ncbi:MAG: hypothetical protein R2770_21980 [Acidimicrobiales bacterium]
MVTAIVVFAASWVAPHPAGADTVVSHSRSGQSTGLPTGLSEADLAAIDALLAARSEAVIVGDVEAMASTRTSTANQTLADRDALTIAGAAAVGLESYSESLSTPVVDLSPPGSPGPVLAVDRRHRIAGVDSTDHLGQLYLTFVNENGSWRVQADDSLVTIGIYGERELWELAAVDVVRSQRAVVVGSGSRARLEQLATLLEQAIDRFDQSWPRPWTGKVAMMVPRDLAEVEALLHPTIDASKFVAFTTLDIELGAIEAVAEGSAQGWNVVAPRIVAQESNLSRRSTERQVEVLVHELAHVASVRDSGPMTPLWMHEGLADWVTQGRPLGTAGDAVEFPDLHLFRTGTASQIARVYDQAAQTMAQLAATFGPDAPFDLFDRVGGARLVVGNSDVILAQTVHDLFGVEIGSLVSP